METNPGNPVGGAASGIGKIVAVSLITGGIAGIGGGVATLYGPELMGKKPAAEIVTSDSSTASSKVKPDDSTTSSVTKPEGGTISEGFRMGSLPPTTAIRSIRVTLEVGGAGAELKEPVDVHLGTGFPLRLYPVGGVAREPSFAAFPTSSTIPTGETAVAAGKSASFEFVADEKTKGLDVLRTTPHLLRDLTVSDLQKVGFACQGHSAWKLAGYRVEVNGQLFAEHGGLDLDVQKECTKARNELGMLLPPHQALQDQLQSLQSYVSTGLATDADKAELEKVKAGIEKTREPVEELKGKVAGYAPWFLESDPGFKPAPLPGSPVKAFQVTLATGGGDQPGTQNPVYLKAGGRKFLLASKTDPLADDPKPQKFQITEADLLAQPLSQEDLKSPGIGMIGSDERFSVVPDRARLQRVLIEADGEVVYDSELKPSDRRTLGTVWLVPPAHLDGSGNVVENTASPTEIHVWNAGMKAPVNLAVIEPPNPTPIQREEPKTPSSPVPAPAPPPKPGSITNTSTGTSGAGTNPVGGQIQTPPAPPPSPIGRTGGGFGPGPVGPGGAGFGLPFGGFGPGGSTGAVNPFTLGFGQPVRRTGGFQNPTPVNNAGLIASIAQAVVNALRPVATPQGPTLSNIRIDPTTPIVTDGTGPVGAGYTVQWAATGNVTSVTRYDVELFGVLPHQSAPFLVPAVSDTVSASAGTRSATIPSIQLSRLTSLTPLQRLQLSVRPRVTAVLTDGTRVTQLGSIIPVFPAETAPGGVAFVRGPVVAPIQDPPLLAPGTAGFQLLSSAGSTFPPDSNSVWGGNSGWIPLGRADSSARGSAWTIVGEQDSLAALRFATQELPSGFPAVVMNTGLRPAQDPPGLATPVAFDEGVMIQFDTMIVFNPATVRGFRLVGHAVFLGTRSVATAAVNARLQVSAVNAPSSGPIVQDLDGNFVDPAVNSASAIPFFSIAQTPVPYPKNTSGANAVTPALLIDLPFRPDRFAAAPPLPAVPAAYIQDMSNVDTTGANPNILLGNPQNLTWAGNNWPGPPPIPAAPFPPFDNAIYNGPFPAPFALVATPFPAANAQPALLWVTVNVWVQMQTADLTATDAIGIMGLRLVPDNTP